MNPNLRRWLQVALFNLLLVALAGVVLRYKIAFSLRVVDQKYLMNGHSHFAFAGWATQALMALLVGYLQDRNMADMFRKYRPLLYANLITAYGMLCSFPLQGYGFVSIVFSTGSIIVSYVFAVACWKDLNRLETPLPCHSWFKAALLFQALSSLGPFSLAYMMASHSLHTEAYLLSVYFFLHFQYNGWFFFACVGLLVYRLSQNGVAARQLRPVFRLFVLACPPALLLSALWLRLPLWVYALVVAAALLQLAAWWRLLVAIKSSRLRLRAELSPLSARLFGCWVLAVSIKLLLQALSVAPALSRLAFGFRPIVIGYLHLVLLGVITLFILGYSIHYRFIQINRITIAGLVVFVAAVVVNELLLMSAGIAGMANTGLPFVDRGLLLAALGLLAGAGLISYGQKKQDMREVTKHAAVAREL